MMEPGVGQLTSNEVESQAHQIDPNYSPALFLKLN